jgi:hypothetical protein
MAHHMNGIPQIAFTRMLLDVPMKASDSVEGMQEHKYRKSKGNKMTRFCSLRRFFQLCTNVQGID